jgi:competence protein ComFC
MPFSGSAQKSNIVFQTYRYLWTAVDWLYPPTCPGCKKAGVTFCLDCLSKLRFLSENICKVCGLPVKKPSTLCQDCAVQLPAYNQMRSWVVYQDSIREAIHDLKYRQNIGLGFFFSKPLLTMLYESDWQIDLVIPIPISRSHFKQRGYNQSALISRPLARMAGIPHSNNSVARVKETATQTTLNAKERFKNMDDAFLGNPDKLKGRSVLVVDDVITTGATMQNCSKAIKKAGAEKVYCLSVARAVLQTGNKY